MTAKDDWKMLDMDAYRKLVEECKDDAEFRRRLKDLPRKSDTANARKGDEK